MKKVIGNFMYRSLTMLAFVIFSVYCYGKDSSTSEVYGKQINRDDYDLKGPVSFAIIKECRFEEEFGEIKRVGSQNTSIYFHSNGNLYKEVYSPKSYKKCKYDDHGYIIEEMVINVGAGKSYKIGNESLCDDDSTNILKYKNEYTSDGKISEIKIFSIRSGASVQTKRIVYNYTSGGKKITIYDKNGIAKEITYSGLVRVQKTETKMLSWEVLTDRLDSEGHLVKRNKSYEYTNGTKQNTSSEVRSYDNHGNEIKATYYLASQNNVPQDIITTQYTYDSHGNWTRMLKYREKKLLSWIERDIYYSDDENDYNRIVQETMHSEELRKQKITLTKKEIESEKEKEIEKGLIVSFPDEFACFPGDSPRSTTSMSMGSFGRLNAWIDNNKPIVQYHGRVSVQFIVECDGSISNIKIIKASNANNEDAIRLVKKMPKWNPAYKDGKPVRSIVDINIDL